MEKESKQSKSMRNDARVKEKLFEMDGGVEYELVNRDPTRLPQELQIHQTEMNLPAKEPGQMRIELEAAPAIDYFDLFESAPIGYLIAGELGVILETNLAFAGMLGYSKKELINKPVAGHIYDADQDLFDLTYRALAEAEIPQSCELRMVHRDSSLIQVRIEGNCRKDPLGKTLCRLAVSNLVEIKKTEQQMVNSAAELQTLFTAMTDVVIVYDKGGRYVKIAPTNTKNFTHSFQEMIGKTVHEVLPKKLADYIQGKIDECLQSGGVSTGEYDLSLHGEETWFSFNVTPLTENSVIWVAHDITPRKKMEVELKAAQDELLKAQKLAKIGSWTYDLVTGQINWSEEIFNVWGLDPQNGAPTYAEHSKLIHPEDYQQFDEAFQEAAVHGTPYQLDLRICCTDGSTKSILAICEPQLDAEGRVIFLRGTAQDITERKLSEKATRISEQRFRTIFEQAGVGVALVETRTGRFNKINQKYCDLLGYTAEEMLEKCDQDVTHPEDVQANVDNNALLVSGERKEFTLDKRYIRKDGKEIWARLTVSPLWKQGETPDTYTHIAVVQDISEAVLAQQELHNIAKFPSENPNPVMRVSLDGKLLYCNNASIHQLHKWDLTIGQEIHAKLRKPVKESQNCEQPQSCFIRYSKKIYLFTFVPIIRNGYVNIYGIDMSKTQQVMAELEQSQRNLHDLTAYWQAAIETERATIAREIHDEFGQSLTALKMDLAWLGKRLTDDAAKLERIEGMEEIIDNSITLIRRIATELRPHLLDDLGLNAALDWQAREFSNRTGIPCYINLPDEEIVLDPIISTSLFRIFQETLTNVIRHAQATRVDVRLGITGEELRLIIQDNGRGISEGEINNRLSLGLLGLRERAVICGGTMTINGVPGKGTTITVSIPLSALSTEGRRS